MTSAAVQCTSARCRTTTAERGNSSRSSREESRIPEHIRDPIESCFGTSFSDVRIHADADSARRASALGARAFTHGKDVYFGSGHYRPETSYGFRLLAHELAHVVQQRNGRFPKSQVTSQPVSRRMALEREADEAARAATNHSSIRVRERSLADELHGDFGDFAAGLRARISGSIEAAADWVMSKVEPTASATLAELNSLRSRLRSLSHLLLSAEVAARFEQIYAEFRADAPSWIPTPSIRFDGGPTQQAGPIAIPIAAILLFVAFLIVMLWYLGNLDPATRRARERAAEEVIERLKDRLRPRPTPEAEPAPGPTPQPQPRPQPQTQPRPQTQPQPRPQSAPRPSDQPQTGPEPTTDVFPPLEPERRPRPRAYPICWPTQLGPPTTSHFVRTSSERDEDEAKQARMALWWRQFRDPDFNAREYHVHHVIPLFLGGQDDLQANGTTIPGRLHLRGHNVLRRQPQMLTPPPPLIPLPTDLYAHPPGIPYVLAGFKEEPGEVCPEAEGSLG